MKKNLGVIIAVLMLLWTACDLEKEIKVNLPDYDSQLVVEGYLVPGQPFAVLISQSSSYFAPFPSEPNEYLTGLLASDLDVTISHKGRIYALRNELFFDPFQRKLFNYVSNDRVPVDFENDFELNVRTPDGKTITATTRILPFVPIDSLVVEFAEDDTLARVLTYFTDDLTQRNYYRRMFTIGKDSVDQDFVLNDRFIDSSKVVFGTSYEFAVGDTITADLFHISEDYYYFLNSVFNADAANGNPFVQPSTIISNVKGDAGAIGIFTGISRDQVRMIIEK